MFQTPILSILQLSLEPSRIIPVDNIIILDATRLRAIMEVPEERAVVYVHAYWAVQSQYSFSFLFFFKSFSFSFLFSSSSSSSSPILLSLRKTRDNGRSKTHGLLVVAETGRKSSSIASVSLLLVV